jgi:hypothetical protein
MVLNTHVGLAVVVWTSQEMGWLETSQGDYDESDGYTLPLEISYHALK